MELSRLRPGDLIAAAGGVGAARRDVPRLVRGRRHDQVGGRDIQISLGFNAWQAFGITDILLALAALIAIGLAVLTATRRSPALPVAASVITAPRASSRPCSSSTGSSTSPARTSSSRSSSPPSSASCACWRSPPAAASRCATSSGRTRRCPPTCARPRPPRARASPRRRRRSREPSPEARADRRWAARASTRLPSGSRTQPKRP